MNYYKQKQHNLWHLEQLASFKKSELFLQSEAFALEGQKTLVWLGNNGSVRMDAAVEPETFLNAITLWRDWQQNNYSEKEEFKYNSWIESQKEMFKETDVYKKSELARFVYSAAYDGSELPHFDGIEVYENGNIELCSGETFENAVKSLSEFRMTNHYELKKLSEWDIEQVTLFSDSESFKNSESFKHNCSDIEIFVEYDGSVVLNDDAEKEVFANGVMSWEEWKQNNYSTTEEIAYNRMIYAKTENLRKPDQIFFKEESHHQQENEECCMSM